MADPVNLDAIAQAVADVTTEVAERDVIGRMWARDHTVFGPDPTEIADRLGWLDAPVEAAGFAAEIGKLAADLDGTPVVLSGMGGSSLFPELVATSLPVGPTGRPVTVWDSTHPAAVARMIRQVQAGGLFVSASKSGSTIETRSHLEAAWAAHADPSRYAVITDGGSELEALAAERGFAATFVNRPDIGGRFSALSKFGLVPAALQGVDVAGLVGPAVEMAEQCARPVDENPGAALGIALSAAHRDGRDKLTLVLPKGFGGLGDWIEQLVAESTGKAGVGILPVVGEPLRDPASYEADRIFVTYDPSTDEAMDALVAAGHPVIRYPGSIELGSEVFRWEVATAVAGAVLGVNPFDQPDVASAKAATNDALAAAAEDPGALQQPTVDPGDLLSAVQPGGYVTLAAFVDPADAAALGVIHKVRGWIGRQLRVAVTLGVGPRFLHSTGQLHKGGRSNGVVIQIFDDVVGTDSIPDVDVPGRGFGFSTLFAAQAKGDLDALTARDIPAGRVTLASLATLL